MVEISNQWHGFYENIEKIRDNDVPDNLLSSGEKSC